MNAALNLNNQYYQTQKPLTAKDFPKESIFFQNTANHYQKPPRELRKLALSYINQKNLIALETTLLKIKAQYSLTIDENFHSKLINALMLKNDTSFTLITLIGLNRKGIFDLNVSLSRLLDNIQRNFNTSLKSYHDIIKFCANQDIILNEANLNLIN